MTESAPYQRDDKIGADLAREAPPGQVNDPSYKTSGTASVPVVDDDAQIDDPMQPGNADSDKQLGTLVKRIVINIFSFGSC